jgi:hypothetical protein
MTDTSKAKKRPKGKAVEETGEVWDVAAVAERCADAARLVKRFCDHDAMPEFLTGAVFVALHLARHVKGVDFWQIEPGNIMGEDFDLKGLETLLAVSQGVQRGLDVEPKKDAAALLSAVIKCPDLPERLRYELANVVTDELTNKVDADSPEILRAMLEQYATSEERGAR